MPKIDKKTFKVLPRTNIQIYKFENKQTYFCRFYIGRIHNKSGRFEKSLKTKNINEAITKATELHRNWFNQNNGTTKKEQIDFDLEIAQPFLRHRVRKYKNKTNLKNNEQGERDKAKWENYLKPFFDECNYNDIEEMDNLINDEILGKLKDDGKSGNTINKYMSLLRQMFQRGRDRGIVKVIPDFPTQEVINVPRFPYENKELNLINQRCREEYSKTKDDYYLGCKDYYNLCRSAGFRPGLEPLSLRRKDFEFISSPKNPNEKKLKFTIWGTKTKPKHHPIANEYFAEKMFDEILNRFPNMSDDDYLILPHFKDRKKLKNKTSKTFVRFSKELKLFYYKNGTRPLYAIRHTYATELYKKGTSIEDIGELMNTSDRMVRSVYLGHTDEALINLHNRIPKLKVIK